MQQSSPPTRQYAELATLGQRLQAAILDRVIFPVIMLMPFIYYFNLLGLPETIDENFTISLAAQIKISLLEIVLFMAVNSYLLKEYGQTLGKRIVGIAIIGENGQKLPLQTMILKRYLPFWMAAYIPVFGLIITIANFLAIFRNGKRRCLHDDIAKTLVIKMPKGAKLADIPTSQPSAQTTRSDVMDA